MRQKIEKLPFYIGDTLIGWLSGQENNLAFDYDPGWTGEEISPSLPLSGASGKHVKAWFKELLPDERRRHTFEHMTRLSLQRIKEFLLFFGEDLPGELSVKPTSEGFGEEDVTYFLTQGLGLGNSLDRATFGTSLGGGTSKAAVIARKGESRRHKWRRFI